MNENTLNGVFRGTVISNYDPDVTGRIKIFVPGVYPEEFRSNPDNLPWAEPCMGLFGGGHTPSADAKAASLNAETGISSAPHNDAELFVMFERGDQNYPLYIGATQSSTGWMSEHNNQHIIQTDNFKLRIDENPTLPSEPTDSEKQISTNKFDSHNDKCVPMSISNHSKKATPTLLEIEAQGNVHIKIVGDVNMYTEGTYYHHHKGDKHLTTEGNIYEKHIGDINYDHEGVTVSKIIGNVSEDLTGNKGHIQLGDFNEKIDGSKISDYTVSNIKRASITASTTANTIIQAASVSLVTNIIGDCITTIEGASKTIVAGTVEETIKAHSKTGGGTKVVNVESNLTEIIEGNVLTSITGSQTTISASSSEAISGAKSITAGGAVNIKGSTSTIAGSSVTLKGSLITSNGFHKFTNSSAGNYIGIH